MEFQFDYLSYFINMAFLTGIVVVLAILFVKLKNRELPKWGKILNLPVSQTPQRVKILERVGLEPRKTLYLIQCVNQLWLIGTTETQVHLIGKVNDSPESESGANIEISGQGRSFSDYLKQNKDSDE